MPRDSGEAATAAVVAVVLAGGQSRRMGFDKALIRCGEELLIQRTCRVALACTDQVWVVTPWGDRYRPLLPATVNLWPESPTTDPDGRRPGPLVALAQVVNALAAEPSAQRPQWALALACDLPNLDPVALQSWRFQLDRLPPAVLAYVPQVQDRWEPLVGFYRVACGSHWQRYLADGGRSLQGWLHQHSVAVIPDVDPRWLTNLNTPADLPPLPGLGEGG